jgi:hypothetical protein
MSKFQTLKSKIKNVRRAPTTGMTDAEIAASQARISETKLVPGYTKIYC